MMDDATLSIILKLGEYPLCSSLLINLVDVIITHSSIVSFIGCTWIAFIIKSYIQQKDAMMSVQRLDQKFSF